MRHRIAAVALAALVTGALSGASPALPADPEATGRFTRIAPRSWAWIAGNDTSSNAALFVGERFALVVDPGLTIDGAREILAAAERLSGLPVKLVVLTHWHPDHSLGTACMGVAGPEVAAHPMTRRSMAERIARAASRVAGSLPAPEGEGLAACRPRLPARIIAREEVVDLGGHELRIFHPGPAHTRGDLVVWSPSEKVVATGDLVLESASPSMGEGDTAGWIDALRRIEALEPRHVIPGHFAAGGLNLLVRFRDYLEAVVDQAERALAEGSPPEEAANKVTYPAFSEFRQFPQYGATFAMNTVAVARELAGRVAAPGQSGAFARVATIPTGKNPHQISFSADGTTAWVAAAGSDRIQRIDARRHQVTGGIDAPGVPLGVIPSPAEDHLIITRFQSDRILRVPVGGGDPVDELIVGGAPSLLAGPYPGNLYLVSVEKAGRMWVVDRSRFRLAASYPVGARPFPPSATSDGRLAFVPAYDDGTVAVIDLWNDREVARVAVGERPSGGTVLPGDSEYAVAVRGENKVTFINTASRRIVRTLQEGIGDSPFSVVAEPSGRFAFVNNTGSHDISVIDLGTMRVRARVPVGETPIFMAVHPSGTELWVASEGSHDISVLAIPPRDPDPSPGASRDLTEVAVLGMIHGRHRTSLAWGLAQVRETIRRFTPDVVCAEIPPDRWGRIWSDFAERGVIEDDRVMRFPEYVDLMLDLSVEMGFRIAPCAAWTREMSDLRGARVRSFETDERWEVDHAAYQERVDEVQGRYKVPLDSIDDPRVIHSRSYDRRMNEELSLYDETLNGLIGPGGWTSINEAHMRLVDDTIRANPGKRILITFGAGHKYWFLEKLRGRDGLKLLDIEPFLPPVSGGITTGAEGESMNDRCRSEVKELHRFFQDWFNGELPDTDDTFGRFSEVMGEQFRIISPAGTITERRPLLEGLRGAHGRSASTRAVRIWVEDVKIRRLEGDLYLATYQEWQEDAEGSRGRLSTAIFRRKDGTPNGVQWLHVHETWRPGLE